jgi:hypothetical protein
VERDEMLELGVGGQKDDVGDTGGCMAPAFGCGAGQERSGCGRSRLLPRPLAGGGCSST